MTPKPPNHELSVMSCPRTLGDVDLFGAGAQEHWYEAYEILHAECPVQVIPGEGLGRGSDGYLLTRHADIARVVRDPKRFKPTLTLGIEAAERFIADATARNAPPEFPPELNAMVTSMATLRPTQALYRAHKQELTDPWVGPGSKRHTEMIGQVVDDLIDDWIDDRQVEFVSQFARPLPQRVMARVLGFPIEDVPRLARWGTAQVAPFVHGKGHRNILSRAALEEQARILEGFSEYIAEHVAAKRRNPCDDMISFLTDVTYQALGRKLTDSEIQGVVYAMVLGGLETTQYAIEEQAQLFCDDAELFREVRADRSKLRAFLEEAMRLRAPTQGLSTRITTRDEVFQGIEVPKGSLLHLRWGAGNVDASEYECPHEIQLDRKRITAHLSFSQGPRTCPGAGLSRLEQSIAWNRLLDRVESIDYAPGNTFLHQPGIMLGTLELHLRFEPAVAV